jgi:hypothetical protein
VPSRRTLLKDPLPQVAREEQTIWPSTPERCEKAELQHADILRLVHHHGGRHSRARLLPPAGLRLSCASRAYAVPPSHWSCSVGFPFGSSANAYGHAARPPVARVKSGSSKPGEQFEIADLGVAPPVGGNRVAYLEQRQRQRVSDHLILCEGIALISAFADSNQGAGTAPNVRLGLASVLRAIALRLDDEMDLPSPKVRVVEAGRAAGPDWPPGR